MEKHCELVQAGFRGTDPTVKVTLVLHSNRKGRDIQVLATLGAPGLHPGKSGGSKRRDPRGRGSGASGKGTQKR